jgi:hypothetical protein
MTLCAASAAHATDATKCQVLSGPLREANDNISGLADSLGSMADKGKNLGRTLGGEAGKAMDDYVAAATEARNALEKFLKVGRNSEQVIEACAKG